MLLSPGCLKKDHKISSKSTSYVCYDAANCKAKVKRCTRKNKKWKIICYPWLFIKV